MALESACIIGGGFYGVIIALYLKRIKRIKNIDIFDKEADLLSRASFVNQARVHNGYHYPRSFTTAYRSRENFHSFCCDWSSCIKSDFRKYYAIARHNSKVNSSQFKRFCNQINAPLEKAEHEISRLFNPSLIESVYKVEEYAFDAIKLRNWAHQELSVSRVKCHFKHLITNTSEGEEKNIQVSILDNTGAIKKKDYSIVFNCTYSGLSQIDSNLGNSDLNLKHEIAELALIEVPSDLKKIGVTVMDGPFFSTMPFPSQGLHSLSHVRYTPHSFWLDEYGLSPYEVLEKCNLDTRVDRMIRDASRYLPILSKSIYRKSLFEVKTTLEKNESDDGRPILFSESNQTPGLYSVLGAKIDNIYDIVESINKLPQLRF